jgi:hypothetical protein
MSGAKRAFSLGETDLEDTLYSHTPLGLFTTGMAGTNIASAGSVWFS